MKEQKVKRCFVGIDVSKDKLDIYERPSGKSWTYPNRDFKGLCSRLKKMNPELIVLEPTGGYELGVINALVEAGLRVSREHAYKIHHHARGSGQLAKTDRVDASMIAHYAQCYSEEIEPKEKTSGDQELLSQLISRRQQLIKIRAGEKNRMEKKGFCNSVRVSCRKIIGVLSKEIEKIEEQIRRVIEKKRQWTEKQRIMRTVKGIGVKVSWTLIGKLPELGRANRKEIAALVGVAPFKNESGKIKKQQSIRGGRSAVRAALYMAILSATKHNPTIRNFYERLLEKGKKKKVAQTACAHKLLRMLNAMVAKGESYNPRVMNMYFN
jgi:transposase